MQEENQTPSDEPQTPSDLTPTEADNETAAVSPSPRLPDGQTGDGEGGGEVAFPSSAAEPDTTGVETQASSPQQAPVSAESRIKERQSDALAKRRQKRQLKLEKIFERARRLGKITNDEVEKVLRVSDATTSRYLAQLVKEGKLKRSGSPEHAFYEPL